jgi:hypothetical protein
MSCCRGPLGGREVQNEDMQHVMSRDGIAPTHRALLFHKPARAGANP